MEISLLRESDAVTLGPLHNRIWRTAYAGLLPPDFLDSLDDEDNTRRWAERGAVHEVAGHSAEGATTLVARAEGAPVGWVSVGPARDDDAPAERELWSLYVDPAHWGAGVADALLDAGLSGPGYLWVLEGNDRAIGFYRRRGFIVDGATKSVAGRVGSRLDDASGVELRMIRAS